MIQQFTIPGRLPGLNEIIGTANCHWAKGYRLKKEAMQQVQIYALVAKIKPVQGRAEVTIACFEGNKKRDTDNVQAGANKIILDALQGMGILQGDGWKYIDRIPVPVQLDRKNPRIEVKIK